MKSEVLNGSVAARVESTDAGDNKPPTLECGGQIDIETIIEAAIQEETIRLLLEAAQRYEAENFW